MERILEYFTEFSVDDFMNWLTAGMLVILAVVSFLQRAQNIIAKFQVKQANEETHQVKVELMEKEKLEHIRNEGIGLIGDMLNTIMQASKLENSDKRISTEWWANYKTKLSNSEKEYNSVMKRIDQDVRNYATNIYNLGKEITGTVQDVRSSFLDKYDEKK